MPSKAKNKKKDNGPTWDDEEAMRVLLYDLETAAIKAFRHPEIGPAAVYFSVLLARCEGRRSDVHPTEAFNIVLLERHIMDMYRGVKAMKKEEARLNALAEQSAGASQPEEANESEDDDMSEHDEDSEDDEESEDDEDSKDGEEPEDGQESEDGQQPERVQRPEDWEMEDNM